MDISLKRFNFSWLPMLFLVLTAGSMLFIFFRKEMLYFAFFLFGFLFLIQNIYKRELIVFFQLLVLFLSLLIVNYLFASSSQSTQKLFANIVIFSSSIFSGMYYSRKENKKHFIDHLYLVLKIILLHAIAGFFIYPLVQSFLFEVSNERYDCFTFLNVFFYLKSTHSFSLLGIEFVRNQGIFWEPGVLQIFLNLLLFITAFIKKKRGLLFWLTILGIFTTLSTTGLVVMFIQLIFIFSYQIRNNILFLPVGALFMVFVYFVMAANISDKIKGDGQFSFQARFFDLVQPLHMAYENPLTGVGLDDEQFMYTRQKPSYSLNLKALDFSNVNEKGSTNSIMFFLAAAGIPFTFMILFMLYRQDFVLERRNWFFVFLLISLMTEPILLRPFFLTFVMSGGIQLISKFRWQTF